jgi:hypothetical protein
MTRDILPIDEETEASLIQNTRNNRNSTNRNNSREQSGGGGGGGRISDNTHNTILKTNPNLSPKMLQHRASVRSISEMPNVIGAFSQERNTRDVCTYLLTGLTWMLVVLFFPLSCVMIFRVVQEFERGKNYMIFYSNIYPIIF